MKIITPITITDARLISSDIAENDYTAWSDATTYARGDYAISATTHTVYRSLTAGNLDNSPDLETAALADPLIDNPDPVNWQVISATNRWKMFDEKPSVQSTRATSIEFIVEPGQFIGGIAGFNISGTTVEIEGYIPGTPDVVVYEKTIDLFDGLPAINWYDYFFSGIETITEFAITDVPPYANARYRVTITNASGTAGVGQMVFGPVSEVGEVVTPGSSLSGLDFSFVQNDEFGNLTRTVREATRLADLEVVLPTEAVFSLFEKLRLLRGGQPAVWVADDRNQLAATLYGFVRDYRVTYQSSPNSIATIQIQGMV